MQNIVGQIASKGNFYKRTNEINRININLSAGANLQIAAPRRVGKSSILYYYIDNPQPGFIHIYFQVESATSQNNFYRKIYKEIIKNDAIGTGKKFLEQCKSASNAFLKRLKGISIAGSSLTFQDADDINYEEELLNLLLGLDLGNDRLVLMIDEFPEVILNIVEGNPNGISEAKKFLQSNRELRNNAYLREKVQFIYTGSNSLNLTVGNLDSSSLINDLASIPVSPLNKQEAAELIEAILENYSFKIAQETIDYIIDRVEWAIPFYYQLIIHEIITSVTPSADITTQVIDNAFNAALEQRNDHHFEHYVKRLKRVFNPLEQKFTMILLCNLAQSDGLSKDEIYNLANGILDESETRRLLEALKYDGYIINQTNSGYKFNSPILKNWWKNHEC